ncbi:MAG: DUF63 family protein [Candidatus Aenigmarchaeota archaeon]|nr:DUF63 family protein [Candidatus Aenigmarchaeota archaeon]
MLDFIQRWYIDPIIYGTGYNPVNTITYGIILLASLVAAYTLLKKTKISIDRSFFISLVPFILFGALLRSYEDFLEAGNVDLNILTLASQEGPRNLLLVSPFMYITVAAIAIVSLAAAVATSKLAHVPYYKILGGIGAVLAAAAFIAVAQHVTDFFAVSVMVGLGAFWLAALFTAKKYLVPRYEKLKNLLTTENTLIIAAHMFDASTTFTAIQFYPYFEQHFLPSFFISLLGPAVMFALKLAVVPAALHYIDKETGDGEKRTLLKLLVLILGLAPGTRNFFRLAMGV